MNTNNEHEDRRDGFEPELNTEQRLQALLCAYVLGEASAEERAEVEAALESSAELRAERARIEATIPVVSNVLRERAGDALSPESTAHLDSVAARRARPRFVQQPLVRLAAGVAIALGAYALYRQSEPQRVDGDAAPNDELVANARGAAADASKDRASASKSKADVDVLAVPPPKSEAGVAAPAESAPVDGAELDGGEVDGGETDASALDFEEAPVEQVEQAPTGDAQNEVAPPPAEAPMLRDGLAITGETLERLDGARYDSSGVFVTSAEPQTKLGQPVEVKGMDVALLTLSSGLNEQPKAPPPTAPAPAGGAYRGAGPAGPSSPGPSSSGPSGPGFFGPGSSGPASPSTGGPGKGASKGSNPFARVGAPGAAEPVLRAAEIAEEDAELVEGAKGFSADAPFEPEGGRFRDLRRKQDELDTWAAGAAPEPLADKDGDDATKGSDDFFLGRGDSRERRFQPPQADENVRLRQRYVGIYRDCFAPRAPESPRDMFFRFWGDNPFELTVLDRQSTFSADVDTASYTLARRYLVDGKLPSKEQIRTEEFVNYFKGDVPAPSEGTFAVATELAPSLFGDSNDTWMMRVAIRGKDVAKAERQPVALTFVVDVSGSMREGNRLELVKHSLRLLVSQMDANDSISLIKFSNDAALLLPMTSARHKDLIESAIHPLQPDGSTNTEAGLRMGYEQALVGLTPNANNRVVLLTDGVANVGITDPDALVKMVERQRKAGVYLNTVGVGMNNHNDNLLEQLADKGDGLCNYVDDEQEVRRALVDNFTGAFQVIARDVKIQVEFDPAQVERYRLLGYENRAIADADFRNDKVDAGEIGAGHQVVALYEIVRRNASGDGPLATVRLRWKPPYVAGAPENEQGAAQEIAQQVLARSAAGAFAATSPGYRRAVLVGQFAEFLRRSVHARRDSLDRLIDEARKLSGELRDKEFDEFVDMATRSRDLVQAELRRRDWLDDCGDLLRQRQYLHRQLEELRSRYPNRFGPSAEVEALDRQLRDLERRLVELRQRVEGARGEADSELVKQLSAENIELQRRLMELLDKANANGDRPVDGK